MRLKYEPRGIGDAYQFFKSFLSGSLITSSILIILISKSDLLILSMIAFIVIGVLMFINILMISDKIMYFFSDVIFLIIGSLLSLFAYINNQIDVYFAFILILTVATLAYGFISQFFKK